jgi:hypothetical protein
VNTGGVGDDNSHDQDDGVFDRDDHGIDDDDFNFDFEELLRHIKPHVLNSMGTDRGLDNMEILEKSSREPYTMNQMVVVKSLLSCISC